MLRLLLTTALFLALTGCGRDWDLPHQPTPISGVCSAEAPCRYGLCVDGSCDEGLCETDPDCRFGLCTDGSCDEGLCETDPDCRFGLCVDGACDYLRCYEPGDCPAGFNYLCRDAAGDEPGYCEQEVDLGDGPDLLGDPTALAMHDNLESAWDFVRDRHPEAEFVQITGLALKADGTVDTTADYTARWMYAFRESAAAPPTFITVTYLLQGDTQGLYDPDAGNVSNERVIPELVWRDFLDSTTLTADALARGCTAPAQASGDHLGYSQTEDGPQFIWTNWDGEALIGDPTTGEVTYDGCAE